MWALTFFPDEYNCPVLHDFHDLLVRFPTFARTGQLKVELACFCNVRGDTLQRQDKSRWISLLLQSGHATLQQKAILVKDVLFLQSYDIW